MGWKGLLSGDGTSGKKYNEDDDDKDNHTDDDNHLHILPPELPDHLRNKTEDLEATSEHFKTTSQKVARKFWWKNVKMIVIICVIVLIIVILIILFATGTIPT